MSFGSDFVPFTEKVTWKDQNKLVHENKKVYDKNNPPDLSENHIEELLKNESIPRESICKICNKPFQNLKKHVESVHEKLKKYQCHICGKIFYQKNHLKDHTESVHNMEKYKKLGLNMDKTQTLYSMNKTSQSLCTICGKGFKNPHILKRHVESVHEKLKRFQCDFCEKKYYQKSHLQEHVLAAHKDFDNENMLLEPNLKWENEENYTNEVSMNTISENISDPVKKSPECTLCGKTFRSKGHVKRHVESVHEKLKKFQCDVCEKKYYQKSHLKEHIQYVHGGFEEEDVLSETNLEG